jgi:hypothetical protein
MIYKILLFVFFAACLQAPSSFAQAGNMFGGTQSDEGEEPPLQMPSVPTAPAAQQTPQMPTGGNAGVEAFFPELPPSRLCRQRDILGLWKMAMVFENPAATELNEYSASPFQYVLFNADSTFGIYKGSKAEDSESNVYKRLSKKGGVLQQYVMHESGVIYFYRDGIAFDSYACFIVADKIDPFSVGQMLFMPPPDKATVRMVKAYTKVFSAPKAQRAANKNKAKNKNKKNKKKR